jgi:translation initiation factor 2-alpha kinase 4
MPHDGAEVVDMVVESFGNEIEFRGVTFSSVKIFHPRKGMCRLALSIARNA